jgi:hypothetical protein
VTKLSLRPGHTGDDAERRSIRIPRDLAQDLEQYRQALGAGTTLNYVIIPPAHASWQRFAVWAASAGTSSPLPCRCAQS